jgi:hypothetical protein
MAFRRQSFLVRLFSVLAFVVTLGVIVTLGVFATDAFACKLLGFGHKCYTATGVVNWTRSEAGGRVLLGDEEATLTELDTNGTFATIVNTADNSFVACTFDALDGSGEKPALCSYPAGITCTGFIPEPCDFKVGTRTSFMRCDTPNSGCSGTVTVQLLDGTQTLIEIPVAKDPSLNTTVECNAAYPTDKASGLGRGIGGKVKQLCAGKEAVWSNLNTVLEYAVRNQISSKVPNTAEYGWSGKWAGRSEELATCSPDTGFPPVSCTNFSNVDITYQEPDPAKCSAANKRCGQSPTTGDVGPVASGCSHDPATNSCTCTCPKCNVKTAETLTNVGIPPSSGVQGNGVYVLSDVSGADVQFCAVKVSGTTPK